MSDQKTTSWVDVARRKLVRENRHDLKTLEGFYIVVRKFSVMDQEKLTAMREKFEVDPTTNIPTSSQSGQLVEFYKLMFRAGVFSHNFTDSEGKKVDFYSDEFLEELFQYADVVEEIVNAILEVNRPLAMKNESQSETLPNGSTTESNSDQEKHFRTVETQQ